LELIEFGVRAWGDAPSRCEPPQWMKLFALLTEKVVHMLGGSEQPPITPLICFWFLELLPDFVSQLFVGERIELLV
jgi:hypothetical protein